MTRPPLTPDEIQSAADLWSEGAGTHEIAEILGLDESLVWNALDQIKRVKIAEAA